MVQGELFREENATLDYLDGGSKRAFLSRHQLAFTLDKLLLAFIGVLVIFVLTYSFGVEHGKRAMEKHLQALLPSHSEILPVVASESGSVSKTEGGAVLVVKDTTTAETTQSTSATIEKTDSETTPTSPTETTSVVPKPTSSLPAADLTKQGAYTVQLVTYDNENLAAKEIDRLIAKGHEGFVITSGRYFQVCANYFENHAKARNFLKQFRENGRYPDAFIRPVVR